MRTIYLRLPTRAAWRALGIVADTALRVDVVGTVLEPTGESDADGAVELAPVDGYHVNLLCTDHRDLSAVDPFVVTPAEPARVWAS